MAQPVVHFDLVGKDGEALRTFYSELFGWNFQMMPGADYGLVGRAPEGIGGGIGSAPDGSTDVVVYVAVPNMQEYLDKIAANGGTQEGEITEIPGVVTYALFTDPQGNRNGIVLDDGTQGPAPDPTETIPVSWFEILGPDGPALRDFYGTVFGWEFDVPGPQDYGMLKWQPGDHGIPGGVGTTEGDAAVTVYTAVDDLQKYLDRAESLGATPVMQPTEVAPGTTIAVFKDPSDNVFGMFLHVHPH